MAIRRLNAQARPHHALRADPVPLPSPQQPPTFNGNTANLYEDVGDGPTEVSKAGFSAEGGKSNRLWQMTPANIADQVAGLTAILGTTQYAPTGTGKLARTLPLADPLYPWMYAASVPTVEGYGRAKRTTADPQLEAPAFPFGALWTRSRFSVESLPRPFPVLSDGSITTSEGTWYPETGGGATAVKYVVANEQYRYCTWEMQPQSDYVTQQRGQMVFSVGAGDPAANKQLNAMPRVYLPNQLYTVTWYQVPVRLVLSPKSYIQRWRGRVNQNPVTGPDAYEFQRGELLYLGYSMKMFTPPVQAIVSLGGATGIVSTEKFCNVTMQFLYTTRKNASPPPADPPNKNYVVGGHNLLPWTDGGFRYVQVSSMTPEPPLPNQPTWLSAPLETLWTDCDSPGGVP